MSLRLAYAGTPQFAATILAGLLASEHTVGLVLTQPDRPAGRGMKLAPSPVKALAEKHGIALHQPVTLKTAETQEPLVDFAPDVLVVAAYGLILPQAVLDIPKHGCLNVHASLLPRWRGAAPIQRAILAGDTETGVTIMQMAPGLDTGYMLLKHIESISQADTSGSVEGRLASSGSAALLSTLAQLEQGALRPIAQPTEGVTYAAKIRKEEARLNFALPAAQLDRVVRAFNPAPIAYTSFRGEPLRVWRAALQDAPKPAQPPGTLLLGSDGTVAVACGEDSALALLELQRPGGKPMSAAAWAAGAKPQPGERLGI